MKGVWQMLLPEPIKLLWNLFTFLLWNFQKTIMMNIMKLNQKYIGLVVALRRRKLIKLLKFWKFNIAIILAFHNSSQHVVINIENIYVYIKIGSRDDPSSLKIYFFVKSSTDPVVKQHTLSTFKCVSGFNCFPCLKLSNSTSFSIQVFILTP